MSQKIIAGNWKENHLVADLSSFAEEWSTLQHTEDLPENAEIVVCPPFPLIYPAVQHLSGLEIFIGGQDCHYKKSGAYTGDTSPALLKDLGASHVILGHSERREYHDETDKLVAKKAAQALRCDLVPIICVGEVLKDREAGNAEDVVAEQLEESIPEYEKGHKIIIAYEPVWAIGTGKVASVEDVKKMHDFIKKKTGGKFPILYGGSVKPDNAKEILAISSVGGVLVGGASLKAADFWQIAMAC
jgi:triosephosphate isomerase